MRQLIKAFTAYSSSFKPGRISPAQLPTGGFLLVFMRYPEAGKVKTRLSGEIGAARAASVYEKLLRRTLGVVSDFKHQNPGLRVLLFHTPGDPVQNLEKKFSGPWGFYPQVGGHLGERMENAVDAAFSLGAKKVVLIGSDISDIEPGDLEEAFLKTGEGAAALGPASDGGFYLIGLDRKCGAPFDFTEWGAGDIFARTERQLARSGLRVETVPRRSDVDRPSDLPLLDSDPVLGKRLTVVIPTLDAPEKLSPLIDFLENRIWPGDEIIVVRGRPSGETGVTRKSGLLTHARCPRGRGIQQNFGAMLAEGDLLFFLHDDTIPPPDFPYHVRKLCGRKDVALGCFRLAFYPTSPSMGLISKWANLRTSMFKLPYGDQGLFCRRDVFEKAGGFRHRYMLEDVDLVKRGLELGKQVMAPREVHSSPDRYLRKGPLAASLENHMIMLLYLLGVSEKEIYSIYYR